MVVISYCKVIPTFTFSFSDGHDAKIKKKNSYRKTAGGLNDINNKMQCPTLLSYNPSFIGGSSKAKEVFFFFANRGATVASGETHCLMHHLLRAAGWDRPQARSHVEKYISAPAAWCTFLLF